MNPLSSVVLGVALLGLTLVVNGTFNHKYDNSRPMIQEKLEQRPVNVTDIMNLKGSIISLQYNDSSNPEWILSGKWQLTPLIQNNTNTTGTGTPQIKFSSTITMTSIDGTKTHKHRLTDFKPLTTSFHNRTAIINGTISLITSEDNFGIIDKRLENVPVGITIMNINTISIDMDKNSVKQHFGSFPIYGKVG
jgi:hypothetical protein